MKALSSLGRQAHSRPVCRAISCRVSRVIHNQVSRACSAGLLRARCYSHSPSSLVFVSNLGAPHHELKFRNGEGRWRNPFIGN